jgi:hypothetical protein
LEFTLAYYDKENDHMIKNVKSIIVQALGFQKRPLNSTYSALPRAVLQARKTSSEQAKRKI